MGKRGGAHCHKKETNKKRGNMCRPPPFAPATSMDSQMNSTINGRKQIIILFFHFLYLVYSIDNDTEYGKLKIRNLKI